MKLLKPAANFRVHRAGVLLMTMTLLGASRLFGAAGQAENAAATPAPGTGAPTVDSVTVTPAANLPDAKAAKSESSNTTTSVGIAEILKMAGAGVSKEVIKTYVEHSSIAYDPSAADIIALKEHGVTDDVTAALFKRGAEVNALASQTPAPTDKYTIHGVMDPDSYDFWWYHYGYPRVLANSQRILNRYQPSYSYRGFDPYPSYSYFSMRSPRLGPVGFYGNSFSSTGSRSMRAPATFTERPMNRFR